MTPARWAQVKTLFGQAIELPNAERAALLAAMAADDPDLAAQVQSLLAAHERPGAFLETVSPQLRATALAASAAAGSRIGERIGAYRIVGVLGTGGMGDVFKAVRDDDQYHAEVAIKLMRADVRNSVVEHRFRSERQILAGLDHRNIARMLDGGTTADFVPYVVMELVAGEPIDQYCNSRSLSVRDRVQLFLQVCAAVSYAHAHLVVHRDLKPGNILVTDDGSVKLLDFGIAKLLAAEGDTEIEVGDPTVTQMRAMTLEYASPEQVAGSAVTAVSDVYSLGVVLYRLLTGQSPYGARANEAQRMAEILSDTVPRRPSMVASGGAHWRDIEADIDDILLMALRKVPAARYGSVEQFGNDLRNYLAGMPVQARGNALRYRAGKFMRRRRVEIAASLLVGCTLIGATFFAMREAREADMQRLVAQRHFDSVRKLAKTLLFELHDEIEKVPGATRSREMLLKTSIEYLDSLYRESVTDRALQEELAVAYRKVGEIQGNETAASTGEARAAAHSYGRSIALLEPLFAADPADTRIGALLATTYTQRARVLLVGGALEEALTVAKKGLELTEGLPVAAGSGAERLDQRREAASVYANILYFQGRTSEALVILDRMLAFCEEYWRLNPEAEAALRSLSGAYNGASLHLDMRLSNSAAQERSLDLLRKGLAVDEKLVALKPDNEEYARMLAVGRYNLARLLYAHGNYTEALQLSRLAAPVAARRAQDANDAQAQYFSALVDTFLGRALLKAGEVEEARLSFTRSSRILKQLAEQDGNLRFVFAHGQSSVRLGELYAGLANNPALGSTGKLSYWRLAQGFLRDGVGAVRKVTAVVVLEPLDMAVLEDGVNALALVEAELAKAEARE